MLIDVSYTYTFLFYTLRKAAWKPRLLLFLFGSAAHFGTACVLYMDFRYDSNFVSIFVWYYKVGVDYFSDPFRYEYLDRFIRGRLQLKPKSMKFVATKVAADGLIFGPLDLLVYFSYIGLASGKSIPQVKEDVKRDFLPGFAVGGGVWPLIQVANFRFVPVRYQLLYVNVFCLLDSSFLSWLEQQGDASWKQWFTSFLGLEDHKGQG